MKILARSTQIVDPSSKHNGTVADIFIEDGIIKQIAKPGSPPKDRLAWASITEDADKIIEQDNLHVSPGWFDMRVNFREPGFEYKEDLTSGCNAAASGGFTGVLAMPSTFPPVHTKSEVEFITNKTKNLPVDVFVAGALSNNLEGEHLSEMFDMFSSGAIAFTDDKKSVHNAGLMLRALMYAKNFGALIISFPSEPSLTMNGKMNEGITGTMLGLKMLPSIAEEIMVTRDLYLTEYVQTKIHFATLSAKHSVELIREARKKKIPVTAEAAAHQLMLDDTSLSGFDTNYKVMPPLRNKEDREALIAGLKDGTIDVICSDHSPEDIESKQREFDHAAFGIIGLETAYAVANTALKKVLSTEEIINKISSNPRKILNIPVPTIEEEQNANLTFFNPDKKWTFTEKHIRSRSKNSPFIGKVFTGKAVAITNKNQFVEC
ncbi:MAG TPA: dihydroorotase [Bacteroidia bacterium]|nr:dihydroorotase [Bacteroidia bacterium]